MKVPIFTSCLILVLIAISDAAPRQNTLQRRQSVTECENEDFSSCHDIIIQRLDYIAGFCLIKDQIESCVQQVLSELQCTLKKDSYMEKTLQFLANINCTAECNEKLEEFVNITQIDFTDDEEFCSTIDRVIVLSRYIFENCNESAPFLTFSEDYIERLIGWKRTRCSQTDAARRQSENILQRRQSVTECENEDFSSCHGIIKRVDHLAGFCLIKGQVESCVQQVLSELQCTLKKDSYMAKTLQFLADMDCTPDCNDKLQEFVNITNIDFTDDEKFCSIIDRVIVISRYIFENCNESAAIIVFSEEYIEGLKSLKRTRCPETVFPDAVTAPMVTTKAATAPPVVTTEQQTTSPAPFTITGQPIYKCFDLFKCPSTSLQSLTPGGNLTTGFRFSEQYFQNICKYIEELFQCSQFSDFTGCEFLVSAIGGYAQYYITLCMDAPQKAELESLIPCMNVHSLQLHVFAAMAKMIGSMETILTWPNYLGLPEATKTMFCRAYHSFVNNAAMFADYFCGVGHDQVVRSVLKALGSLAEQTLGQGCVDQNPNGPNIQWSFFFPAGGDDLFDDIDDDMFGGLFGDK